MSDPSVKICGLCRPDDAAHAAASDADYLGVVLAPGGSRTRTLDQAAEIFAAGEGPRRVGVFIDPPLGDVSLAADRLGLDVIQFHGRESPERVEEIRREIGREVWKAIRPRGRDDLRAGVERYARVADGLLLDGWSARAAGGTGTRFPWDEVAAALGAVPRDLRLVVAGGLTPDNVGEAIERFAPHIVDVSSGVERGPGEKSPERVRRFIARASEAAGAAGAAGAGAGL